MTDAASNIASSAVSPGTAAAEPFIYWQGQPFSRESAATKRTELMADPKFVAAATNGDVEKQAQLAALWQIARTGSAPDAPPANIADIVAGMTKADQERAAQMHEWQRARIAPQDDVQALEFERGEATAIQKEAARRNIDRAKRDPDLARKIIAGDGAARLAWDRWHWIAYAARQIPG